VLVRRRPGQVPARGRAVPVASITIPTGPSPQPVLVSLVEEHMGKPFLMKPVCVECLSAEVDVPRLERWLGHARDARCSECAKVTREYGLTWRQL
jgi:hypothetical protein